MKKNQYNLLITTIISLALIFASCKKNEEDKNFFTYDLTEYIINYGSLISYGATDHSPLTYEFELMITGPGITFDNTLNDFKGTGNFIELTLYSYDSEFLAPGNYVFDGFSSKDSTTFDYGVLGINYDLSSESEEGLYDIKTGIVQVEKRGNLYTLTLNLFTQDDKQIKGFFSGFLQNNTPAK
jgi:hypothetical protein